MDESHLIVPKHELQPAFELANGISMRTFRETDAESVFSSVIRNRDHLAPFMHWMTGDYSFETARKFIADSIEKRRKNESLGLGIFRGPDLIGSIGFVNFDWSARKAELGYWIDEREEGRASFRVHAGC